MAAKKSSGTGRSSSAASRKKTTSKSEHSGHPLIAHEEIRNWAEDRGAAPACVKGTGGGGDAGMIRLDFPGYSGEESLQHISWDDWFEKFDENDLALMVQDTTAGGERSNFNKLVKRTTVQQRPRARAAR